MWGRWLLPENTFICLLQKCDFCLSCSFTFVFFWFFYHCTSRATCTSSVHHFRIGPKTSCPFICFVSFKKKIQEAAVSDNKLLLCWYCVSIFPRGNQCNQRLFIPCTKLSRLSTDSQILGIWAQQPPGKRYLDSLMFLSLSSFYILTFDFLTPQPPPHFAFHPKCSDITVVWQTNSFLTTLTSSCWCWRGDL